MSFLSSLSPVELSREAKVEDRFVNSGRGLSGWFGEVKSVPMYFESFSPRMRNLFCIFYLFRSVTSAVDVGAIAVPTRAGRTSPSEPLVLGSHRGPRREGPGLVLNPLLRQKDGNKGALRS